MIRINLLAGERRAAAKAAPARSFQIGQKITVLGSLIVLVTLLLLGWRYWDLGRRDTQMARDIEAARREEQRLAEVLKQVADFEAQRKQLQQRVALIDELRRGQTAPVHMIDQVSRALPDMTWLTQLRQEGYDVTIEGRSTSMTALSDFVANLEGSRYFKRPVEIIESEIANTQPGEQELVSFSIKGTFQMAGIESAPGPAPRKK